MSAFILVLAFLSQTDGKVIAVKNVGVYQSAEACENQVQPLLVAATLLLDEQKRNDILDGKVTMRVVCIHGDNS